MLGRSIGTGSKYRCFTTLYTRLKLNELHCEKTHLQGFRPGPTKTSCTATENSKRLEIWDLKNRGIVLSM